MNILDEDYIADLITINNHDYVLFLYKSRKSVPA